MSVLKIAMVAGELSGDVLGAGLLRALTQSGVRFEAFGIGGPSMQDQGLQSWWDSRDISVMGLSEVVRHLPRLLNLKRQLIKRLKEQQPDIFIGIDLPDFNLRIAKAIRSEHCATVQYVSPSVWAWRPKRVKSIARAIDQVLCLLPFEPDFYREHNVAATFVGHPLADKIRMQPDTLAARRALDLASDRPTIALLPGSRASEVKALARIFLESAELIKDQIDQVQFVTAMASDHTRMVWQNETANLKNVPPVEIREGPAETVIAAADAVLLASGTVALEALLVGRPMVVCYRVSELTRWMLTTFNLVNVNQFSLPNLLAGRPLVPELLQDDAKPEKIADAVVNQFQQRHDATRSEAYAAIRKQLSQNADTGSAKAVLQLLTERGLYEKPA